MQADTFEELEDYLRGFINFHGRGEVYYDFVGTFVLFEALVDNLSRYSLPADLESLAEIKDAEPILNRVQIRFLRQLLERAEAPARSSRTSA
jgi:hypothetical protein